ncbi:unnamed protein product [Urochloa humidicola]
MATERLTGTVKWFNPTKGFGFITPDDGSEDLFVHQSSLKSDGYRSLNDGEIVEFEVSDGSDGRTKAVEVTAPGGAPLAAGQRPDGGANGGRYGGGDHGYWGGGDRGYGDGGGDRGNGGVGDRGYDGGGDRGYGGNRGYGGGGRGCYKCGEEGHIARDCIQGGGGGGYGGGRGSRCFSCGEDGHISRDCPRRR